MKMFIVKCSYTHGQGYGYYRNEICVLIRADSLDEAKHASKNLTFGEHPNADYEVTEIDDSTKIYKICDNEWHG